VKKISVLMVCRHNICRSPIAEGLLRHYLNKEGLDRLIKVDSAGTHGDMLGSRIDERAHKVALNFGVDLGRRKSRRIKPKDYVKFDHILAMDQDNYQALLQQIPTDCIEKLALVLAFSPESEVLDVPDPYYGSQKGFEQVFVLLDAVMKNLVDFLINNMEAKGIKP